MGDGPPVGAPDDRLGMSWRQVLGGLLAAGAVAGGLGGLAARRRSGHIHPAVLRRPPARVAAGRANPDDTATRDGGAFIQDENARQGTKVLVNYRLLLFAPRSLPADGSQLTDRRTGGMHAGSRPPVVVTCIGPPRPRPGR